MAGEVTHTGHTPEPGKMQAGVPVAQKYVGLTVKESRECLARPGIIIRTRGSWQDCLDGPSLPKQQ